MSASRPPTLLRKLDVENGAVGARGPDGFYDSPEFEGSKNRYCGGVQGKHGKSEQEINFFVVPL